MSRKRFTAEQIIDKIRESEYLSTELRYAPLVARGVDTNLKSGTSIGGRSGLRGKPENRNNSYVCEKEINKHEH